MDNKDREWIVAQNALLIKSNEELAKFRANFFEAKREVKKNAEDLIWNDDVRYGLQMALNIFKEHDCMSHHEREKQNKPDLDCALRN